MGMAVLEEDVATHRAAVAMALEEGAVRRSVHLLVAVTQKAGKVVVEEVETEVVIAADRGKRAVLSSDRPA